MNRRDFLRVTAASGSLTLLSGGCAFAPRTTSRVPAIRPFELDELTIAEFQSGIASGRFTATKLVEKYLARIEQIDHARPALKSVIEINPDAFQIARDLEREREAKGPRSALHGIPVLIKDNIDTHDRMNTTAGSLALAGSIAPRDAFIAQRLREAGAVILGKTNLSEWANFRSSRSTSGWSGRGGLTHNPYALDRNPSGSSSGSAVAVSANLCAVAVGTETDGSIMSPSSVCGVVGMKPTVGLWSRSGIIPISHTQDTAGPMARTVTDAAILLGALAGHDSRDETTTGGEGKVHRDYTRFLDPNGLRGARIGVARKFFRMHRDALAKIDNAIAAMKDAGAVIVDPADLPSHGQIGGAEFELMLYEFKAGLKAYLAELGPNAPVRSLKDVIEFNERNKDREMPHFGQETFLAAQEKGPLTDKAYLDARDKCRRLSRAEGIDAIMDQHKLDALLAPTTGPAAVTDLVHGDRGIGGSSSSAAVAGYPSITVPAGFVAGLPFGISFFGRAWSEPALLRIAFAFEQMTKARQPPRFLRSTVEA